MFSRGISRFCKLFSKSYWHFLWCLLYCNHRRERASQTDTGAGDILYPGIPDPTERCPIKTTQGSQKNRVVRRIRQWAVEKLPKAIHFHNQTRGYANGLICQKNKEEYSSRRPQGFPSMEGKPKDTLVWFSKKSKPFRQIEYGGYAKEHFCLNFEKRKWYHPRGAHRTVFLRSASQHGGLRQRTALIDSSKTRMQCPFHPIDWTKINIKPHSSSYLYTDKQTLKPTRTTPMY